MNTNMAKEEKKKNAAPVFHIKGSGGLDLAVWKNQGEKGSFYSATVQRSYTTDNGKSWEKSDSFRAKDLLPMSEMFRQAYLKVQELIAESKEEDEE